MAITGSWVPSGNDQQRLSAQLRGAISQLAAAASTLQTLSNVMSQMVSGSDYTTIETYFGVATGEGQTLHDVLGTASSDLQGSPVQGLLQRFG
jgi:hypothetical protein